MNITKLFEDKKYSENVKYLKVHALRRYNGSAINKYMDFDDFYQLCLIRLHNKFSYFDDTKGSLNTFIGMIVNSETIQQIQVHKLQKRNKEDMYFEPIENIALTHASGVNENTFIENMRGTELIKYLKENLKHEKDLLVLGYKLQGHTCVAISEKMGLTYRTVICAMDRIKKVTNQFYNK